MLHLPNMLWMAIDDDVISGDCVVGYGLSAGLLQSDVLRADGVFQSLRRLRHRQRRLSRRNHFVVDAFIARDINRQ